MIMKIEMTVNMKWKDKERKGNAHNGSMNEASKKVSSSSILSCTQTREMKMLGLCFRGLPKSNPYFGVSTFADNQDR